MDRFEYLATTATVDAIDATDTPENPYQSVAKNLKRRMEWALKLSLRILFLGIAYVFVYTVIQVEASPEVAAWAHTITLWLALTAAWTFAILGSIWFFGLCIKLIRFAFSRKGI